MRKQCSKAVQYSKVYLYQHARYFLGFTEKDVLQTHVEAMLSYQGWLAILTCFSRGRLVLLPLLGSWRLRMSLDVEAA